ncbi:MAG: peptidoglycan DD-metalloendopeptidase family protein [Candidatus Peribacteria bacterium]|nr:peptidoglycan DD-metalloendopeptidase family protein [Candidatus Peribacteria bacterium]
MTQELFDLDAVERAKNANLDEKYRQARNEIVRVINSINVATTTISQSASKLVTYQKQMQNVVDELNALRSSAGVAKLYLAEYLNLLYKMQLEIYEDADMHTNDLRLLVNSENISQTLVGADITAAMTAQLNELLQQADTAETNNVILLSKLGKLKQQAQTTLNSYREEIEKLQQKKQYLLNFIELYKNEQVASAQRFDKVFASKKEVYLSIQTFLDEIVKKNYKSVDGIADKIAKLAEMPDAKNENTISPIARPVYPIEQILRYYNDPQFEIDNGFKHQAIQIQAAQRSPVYAARDGVVYHVFDNMDSISRVMIVHQNGFVTTYQYLNQIIVKPGDMVSRGQIIGYSGGEPGTSGAGFVSEGENLTFGVYQHGLAIDPLMVLDLSVVTNWQSVLPEEYRLKYLNDNMVRPINVRDLTFAEGNTVEERSQNFLSAYAKGIYRDLNFRDSVVVGTNIDRDMVICVGFAESTLGNYLSTSNNIGNVGNNDRGDRIAYGSPYDGARLIALTLNNPYLGHYHTINQLSRYGNADGKIYASSPINWQTNVLKCLSKIKGYTIPEDFPFRTGPNPELSKGN